ncbi:alpha/beta hydrolase [Streptomyces sp. S.PB5]|uniref:alpha/beta fold hydrolase n=1 Tax=Streptomyces sp. S.PB5 TaxID=3020844 RepID=UPI0025B27E22|nr:alpha/beta hydrolase [Streptomyces sp. S.PB5]MDN3023045.1 alpha/beta hydrolase [Streptomyces sp. S.PB5]
MRRTFLSVAAALGFLMSSSGTVVEAAPETIRYGGHERQTITVYGVPGAPAVVILHGGYWAEDADWSRTARWLAGQGFRVYETDYRLNTDARWPAQREDVRAALRWIGAHSAGRPLLLGSSAGGQLALDAATYGAGRDLVRGVVALSPVASPYRAWVDGGRPGATAQQRRLRQEAQRLVGCDPDRTGPRCWARWSDLAAHTHASGADDAPMLLIHSQRDFVPPAHSDELAAEERRLGHKDITVRTPKGASHGGALMERADKTVLSWLKRHS